MYFAELVKFCELTDIHTDSQSFNFITTELIGCKQNSLFGLHLASSNAPNMYIWLIHCRDVFAFYMYMYLLSQEVQYCTVVHLQKSQGSIHIGKWTV